MGDGVEELPPAAELLVLSFFFFFLSFDNQKCESRESPATTADCSMLLFKTELKKKKKTNLLP